MRYQQTVAHTISCAGVGLHTGEPATLTLRPAPLDTGIVFVHKRATRSVSVGATVRNLVPTEHCTSIGVDGIRIRTIEHVLSALVGLEVDNVFVDLDAEEVPAMDGSASAFVRLIREAGVVPQERVQPFLRITQPVEVAEGNRLIRVEPASSPRISYTIQYDHPLIRTQTYVYDGSASAFEQDIAEARTYVFLTEVEGLWARGLGRGGSLENTIVLSDREIVNESGLRFQDEFVRHKILDLIGDLALLGVPFIGHLIARRSGHALHKRLVKKILDQPDTWVLLNGHQGPVQSPSPSTAEPLPSEVPNAIRAFPAQ